ncbi:Processing alpha glucosidase I [Terramyces sp. JEL0728]|nr:Processing alpha glucosidase I [Terramyces sp. JEL0728]
MAILHLACLFSFIQCGYNESMYWVNRPNLDIRHTCEQDDTLAGYAWNKHDGLNYGSQIIKDTRFNVAIKTEFVKIASASASDISLLYYLGLDGKDGELKVVANNDGEARIEGDSSYLKNFRFLVSDKGNSHVSFDNINIANYNVEGEKIWQVKDLVLSNIIGAAQRLNNMNLPPSELFKMDDPAAANPNLVVVQHMLSAPFVVEYAVATQDNNGEMYFGESLSNLLALYEDNYAKQFEKVFQLSGKGFDESQVVFGQMLLGNMLGGLGYFYGTGIVDKSPEVEEDAENSDYFGGDSEEEAPESFTPEFTEPYHLFTGVPSRPFFPRGFLWDSGFDQLLIAEFNVEISMDIMNHWANLIDENGWVAREQILGDEARSKVPKEFQTQYTYYANPPTMVGGLRKILEIIKQPFTINADGSQNAKTDGQQFLHYVYPKFKSQYEWFKNTQVGEFSEWDYSTEIDIGFKWRGRKDSHLLTSGLDDYPRSAVPHAGDLHLDLLSWMIWFAKTLKEIANELELAGDVGKFAKEEAKMQKVLNELHWDKSSGKFFDVSFHSNGEFHHVQHTGYVSVLPLALGLIPPGSDKLGKTLDVIYSDKELWSDFGLCSLSKSDELFGQGENYWRGPIWVNINYLVLQSLYQNYIHVPGPFQQKATKIYNELRSNLIKNVYNQYLETGYVWEQVFYL